MLKQLQRLTEDVGGRYALIDQWLQARKHLLLAYYHLLSIQTGQTPAAQTLDGFCHHLVDYLSVGHFHVYERMLQESAMLNERKLTLASHFDMALRSNTQQIMDIYDSHLAFFIEPADSLAFRQALSGVGEALAMRFTLENSLIRLMFDH
ncbi:Rsd/AlgQ family anti-sigma factor [Dickeya chrysanthemi]|uniref:Regulator of sigma D n=1 Tax=Dickeya chrysanthemi TaxID=556 RepID=A0ABU8JQW5_DICCH|nr:Rsd/AlgQ family anti-sigma factor [Dickeya chrysanthemi]MBX9447930.1 Rsd/AlgQ family anti-sigma factor [Dickeya chrysanthemi]MCA7009445.1 Rsd/AlgQ family anti-sigma factor [Dickeya chrysanthemi]